MAVTYIPKDKPALGSGDMLRFLLYLEQKRTAKEEIGMRKEELAERKEARKGVEEHRAGELELGRDRLAETGRYYDILGRDVDLRAEKQEALLESERQIATAKAAGATEEAERLKRDRDYLDSLPLERYGELRFASEILAGARATQEALREQVTASQLQLQQMRTQVQWQNFVRADIETRLGMIDRFDMAPTDRMTFKSEWKNYYTAKAAGKTTAEMAEMGIRTEAEMLADMREASASWRDVQLKELTAREKREEVIKTREIRERGIEWPPKDKTAYEYGSYLEVDETMRPPGRESPETRYVYYNPIGWGLRTREEEAEAKVKIPSEFQRAGYKLMTEKRATELGVHNEWLRAERTVPSSDNWNVDEATNEAIRRLILE